MTRPQKETIVGTYSIGWEAVMLVLRDGEGAEIYTHPDPKGPTKIVLGADNKEWHRILDSLLHETIQLAMLREGCRFAPNPDFACEAGNYVFVMDHAKFSSVAARAALFLAEAVDDLKAAWKKRGGK